MTETMIDRPQTATAVIDRTIENVRIDSGNADKAMWACTGLRIAIVEAGPFSLEKWVDHKIPMLGKIP